MPTDAWTADRALTSWGSLITVTLNGTLVSTVEGADDVKSKVHDVGTPFVCGIGRVTGRVRGGGRGGVTLGEKVVPLRDAGRRSAVYISYCTAARPADLIVLG